MLRAFQPESKFNDLDDLCYADIANSLGGRGVRVSTRRELQVALDGAVADKDCFQLIEIIIPRGVMSATLTRYVEGFKAMRKR